jgi:hypothetical protein
MEKGMIARILVLLVIAAVPVTAAEAQVQAPQRYRLTLPQQPTNIAGTTPQRIERGPSLRERVSRVRERIRARRNR